MLIEHPLFATRASRAYLDEHFTILAAQLAKLHESGKLAGTAPEIGKKPIEIDRIGRRSLAKRIVAWAVKQLDVAQVYPAASFSFTFAIAACIGLGATMLIDWDILLALLVGVNAAGFIALALFLRARIDRAVSQMKSETTAQATRAFANLSSRLDALENSTSSSTNS
ncbi:MAG: hypothetical protein GYB36_00940 [Alphaproteobacteria bacterium]|nr:hypothetical protein [Alphaproteobacteria bacterium]